MKKIILFIALIITISSNCITAQTGNVLFGDAIIHEIRFDNVDTSTFFLYANKGIYSMCKITIDGTVIDSIGVTTKGNISWGHANNKRPLKIDLNEFVSGKKYDGIKKFYLHNSYEDPSLMREKLTYDICTQMGLHSLRTAFSKVYINNVYWGVYTLIEAKDELYKRDFNNKNSEVYESLDLGSPCIFSQAPFDWAVANGNPAPAWPRFHLLTDKLATTPTSQYLDTIPEYLNITDFFKYQAVNVYLLNFDSFLAFNGNQLYLYDSIFEDRFQIIPWDFNASFGLWNTSSYNPNTLDIIPAMISGKCPFDKINAIPQLKNTYLDAMCLLKNNYCDTLTFNNKITMFYNQIKTAVYSDWRKEPINAEFDLGSNYGYQIYLGNNVPGLKTFINERWLKIKTDLENLPYTCTTVGIETHTISNSFLIFPNPATSSLTLNQNISGNLTYKIVNLTGQEIQSGTLNQTEKQISVSTFSDGVYILQVFEGYEPVGQQKFIKSSQ